jgi:hypothetical protein
MDELKYKLIFDNNNAWLKELINGEYKTILHLSSVNAINQFLAKKGIILTKKNCIYIHP